MYFQLKELQEASPLHIANRSVGALYDSLNIGERTINTHPSTINKRKNMREKSPGLTNIVLEHYMAVYGWPETQDRYKSWALLSHICSLIDGAWMCIGDFNEMLNSSEKLSCRPAPPCQLDAFCAALEQCNLVDLGFIGYPFTWNNRRPGAANTKEWLDRAVANQVWRTKFPKTTVTHIVSHSSDHLPLILQNQVPPKLSHKGRRWFKFEEAWLLWDDCEKVIQEAWVNSEGRSSALETVSKKISGCASELLVWGASKTHPGTEEIKNLQKRIEVLNRVPPTQQNMSEFLQASKELDDWLRKQEIYWAQ